MSRCPKLSLIVATLATNLVACTSYDTFRLTLRDNNGQPLKSAVVQVGGARYMMRIPPPADAWGQTDETGSVVLRLPTDTLGLYLDVWTCDPDRSHHSWDIDRDWNTSDARSKRNDSGSKGALQLEHEIARSAHPEVLRFGRQILDESDASFLDRSPTTKQQELTPIVTPDGKMHEVRFKITKPANGVLSIGDFQFLAYADDTEGNRYCPAALHARPLLNADRQCVAVEIRGRRMRIGERCRDSSGQRISVMLVYCEPEHRFIPEDESVSLLQELTESAQLTSSLNDR